MVLLAQEAPAILTGELELMSLVIPGLRDWCVDV